MKNYRKISPKRLKKLITNYQILINFYKKEMKWWKKDSNKWFDNTMTYSKYYSKQLTKNKKLLYWNIGISIALIFESIMYLIK